MKNKKIIWGSLLAVSVVGLGALTVYNANKSIVVHVARVSQGSLANSVAADGHIEAVSQKVYFAPENGVVASLKVKIGDRVKKGQVLYTLDTTDLEQQLEIEKNNLQIAKDDRKAAAIQLDEFDLKVKNEQILVDSLENKIQNATVYAMEDGVVSDVSVKNGQAVTQGGPVLTVYNPSAMQVDANLNEMDSAKVKVGMSAQVTGDGFDGTLSGKVTFISPTAETMSQNQTDPTIGMTVTITKPDANLRLGSTATVEVTMPSTPHLLAPLSAVQTENGESYMYTVVGDKSHKIKVQTGNDDGENIEVLSGLHAGDQVISTIPDNMADGKKVSVQ